ncbi:chaperonin 10-like protein [Aspergillus undulatus]|uniref:chaperonin 10-like protein n=1 Tax=Aspergillus undulatus TaxID=1810928 RepID=UPI003CCE01B5
MAEIPHAQTVALIRELGGPVEFPDDYPVPSPGTNEVLAKILYTGNGTATGPDGIPITKFKLPHVGGHEGVGRIVAVGPGCGSDVKVGTFVGIRFASRICRRCEFCLAGTEQYCVKGTNHLHHEDGSFQQYIALDADYLTILPDDVDPKVIGPVLCAGVTAYKAVLGANIRAGHWLVVVGAGGGLGHFAVQYAKVLGAQVIGVDAPDKRDFVLSLGATEFIDFVNTDPTQRVHEITGLGAHSAVVTASSAKAFAHAIEMLRPRDLAALESSPSTLFSAFTSSTAWTLGLALRNKILSLPTSQRKPALVSITLGSGPTPHIVFQCATEPGTVVDNDIWVRRKRNTVVRWGVSSWLMRRKMIASLGKEEGVEEAFVAKFALGSSSGGKNADEYAIHGGGFPVRVKGVDGVVGVIVVSGLRQEDDHQVIVEVVREFVGMEA